MNTKIRVCCLLLSLMTTLAATPCAMASAATGHETCSRLLADPSKLPHTADAIEGWFWSCRDVRHDRLPATADGAAGWLASQ